MPERKFSGKEMLTSQGMSQREFLIWLAKKNKVATASRRCFPAKTATGRRCH